MTSKKNNQHNDPESLDNQVKAETEAEQTKDDNSPAEQASSDVEEKPAQDTSTESQPAATPNKKSGSKLGAVAIVLTILFGAGIIYQVKHQDDQHRAELEALRSQLKQAESTMQQQVDQATQQAVAQANQAKAAAETILAQQQKSIESLQVALTEMQGRRPNDWLLAESDYLVKLAGRKLFLEHDVVSATSLMESADQRIAALNDPSLVPLRKAMANDITNLKSVPLVDRDGLVLRLIALQRQVEHLPLANAILPEAAKAEVAVVSEDVNDWQNNLMTSLKDFADNFITFRTRDGNVIPLLSPKQHFYLRENLKAKLETAIKAVYDEQQDIYQASVTIANEWSVAFFNQNDSGVQEFNQTLTKLADVKLAVNYPEKLESQPLLSDVIRERLRREVTSLITEDE